MFKYRSPHEKVKKLKKVNFNTLKDQKNNELKSIFFLSFSFVGIFFFFVDVCILHTSTIVYA